jgi:hypothetical protein
MFLSVDSSSIDHNTFQSAILVTYVCAHTRTKISTDVHNSKQGISNEEELEAVRAAIYALKILTPS